MKKGTALIILAGVIAGAWLLVRRADDPGLQADPVQTVRAYMDTIVKITGLVWDERKREAMKADLEEFEAAEARGESPDPQVLRQHLIKNLARLFERERFGKALTAALLLFEIDAYTISRQEIKTDRAVITVRFEPKDIFGLKKMTAEMGVPQSEEQRKPILVPLELRKSGDRWYIFDLSGELATPVRVLKRLR